MTITWPSSREGRSGREFACEDLTITDCIFKHGHGVSIGSETVGGVRNVTVRRCRFEGTENGIRIKSPRGRGGTVENLVCEDITMSNVVGAITITTYYPRIPKADTAQAVTAETPKFQHIRIANLKATSAKDAGVIVGLPESLVQKCRPGKRGDLRRRLGPDSSQCQRRAVQERARYRGERTAGHS